LRRVFSAARGFQLRRHQGRRFLQWRREQLRGLREGFEIGPRPRHRARSAQELHPRGLPHFLDLAQQDGAYLAGGPYVRPAARAAVQPFDGYDAQLARPFRGLAQVLRLRGVLKPHRHRPVLAYDFVGAPLGFAQRGGLQRAAFEIDGRYLAAQVKPHRAQSEQPVEHRRKQVLSGVLLHVVEAPAPIHRAFHGLGGDRRSHAMGDALVFIHHLHHPRPGDGARIERLPPRGRVEGRTIQIERQPVGGPLHNPRRELAQVGIRVIEAFGHKNQPFWQTGGARG
jgi:hypothetical protein